jgi:mevalonate pyrophosphate decarboxylase
LNATNDSSQLWSLTASGSAFIVQNKGTGLVMDDPHSSTSSGTGIILYTPDGGTNQNWTIH